MVNLNCSTLVSCRSSATLAISQLTSQWHTAIGAAIVFGLLTFLFILYHLLAKCAVWYRRRSVRMVDRINQTELGSLSTLERAQHRRSSCEYIQQLSIMHQQQQEGQQDLPSSSSTYDSYETMAPDVDRFDLVSCTQHGITLHSAQNPLSPLGPRRFHMPRPALQDGVLPSPGGSTAGRTQADLGDVADEHLSSLPQLVTASSAQVAGSAPGEVDDEFVARPFSSLEEVVRQESFANGARPTATEEPQKPRWPFFQDRCVLEEGMLSNLFDDCN